MDSATGARVTDVDGNEYIDFALGDTGAMTGHALPFVADVLAERARHGITTMLPTEDAIWVAGELKRRFGLAALAAGAYRHRRQPVRPAHRALSHRPPEDPGVRLVLPRHRGRDPGHHGPARARPNCGDRTSVRRCIPSLTTKVVEFNDIPALEAALRARRRGLRTGRAGSHQHRHRPARSRLPRRSAARSARAPAPCW